MLNNVTQSQLEHWYQLDTEELEVLESSQIELMDIISTDCVNYKEICTVLEWPYCDFKCNQECGEDVCHHSNLKPPIVGSVTIKSIIQLYKQHKLSKALVCQGFEPFDSFYQLRNLIQCFRHHFSDPVVIYTGYESSEIKEFLLMLKPFANIIIKFGRFKPNQDSHFDPLLGVELASDNQYAVYLSNLELEED